MAAGLTGDALIEAVARIEAALGTAAPARTPRQERNARYYQSEKGQAAHVRASDKRLNKTIKTVSDVQDASENPLEQKDPTPQKTQTLSPHSPPSGAHTPHGSTSRGSFLPATWEPTGADLAYALTELGDERAVRREVEKFRDFWAGKSGAAGRKRDWPATWRNWVRKAADDLTKTRGNRNANSSDAVSFAARQAARLREQELPSVGRDGEGWPAGRVLPFSGPS